MVDELELELDLQIGFEFAFFDDEKSSSGRPRPISNACKKSLLAPLALNSTPKLLECSSQYGG